MPRDEAGSVDFFWRSPKKFWDFFWRSPKKICEIFVEAAQNNMGTFLWKSPKK